MLQLRVYGAAPVVAEAAARLDALDGSRHVIRSVDGGSEHALVTADLEADWADHAITEMQRLGVPADDIVLLRLDSLGPAGAQRPLASVVWADMLSQAGANARPLARYLVFMAAAGVIAGFGVIYRNGILIVGAMAISPDTLPVTATCTALVLRRWRLAARAFTTLAVGLGVACLIAGLMTLALDTFDLLPGAFQIGQGGLQGLSTVNVSTPIVAGAAGIAAILALETRASASVGVAISVTTIPASAYLGVAAAVGELSKAEGALLVLAINVAMLMVGGSAVLLLQRRLAPARRRAGTPPDRAG